MKKKASNMSGVRAEKTKPEREKRPLKMIWKKALVAFAIVAACVVFLFWAYEKLTDQSHVDETFYQVESDKLVSNVRAVFLSDLHMRSFGEDNADLVARVKELNPDLILIGGDMNTRQDDDYELVLSLCRQLKEIADVYYALGNHEFSRMNANDRDIYYDIEATGVTMLNNVFTEVEIGGNTIYIGGVSLRGNDVAKYSKGIIEKLAAQDGFKLLISHYPSNFELINPYDIDLVLAGHLHGGQVVLPYLDGLYSTEDGFFPPYTKGKFEKNGTMMIVSRGLGNSHKLPRVNNNPELVVVDLYGSSVSYNTVRLLSQLERDKTLLNESDSGAAVDGENDGNMFGLMKRKEAESDDMAGAALNTPTPEPTAEPTPAPTESMQTPAAEPDNLE